MVADLFDQPVNATDPSGFFFAYPNDITGGLFVIGIIIAVYIIVFGSLLRFGIDRALSAASFVGLLTTIVFAALGLIPGNVFAASVVILIVAILFVGRGRT